MIYKVKNLKIKTNVVTVDNKQYNSLYVKPVSGSLFYDDETGEIIISEDNSKINRIAVKNLALNLSLDCDEAKFEYIKRDKENVWWILRLSISTMKSTRLQT